jgi:hypothetical protein
MPNVWPVAVAAPVKQRLIHSNVIVDFGDGFEQRLNKNLAYTRADGEGGVTSYKGRIEFEVSLDAIKHANSDSTKEFNKAYAFLKAQLGSLTAFYFYNPVEAAIDLTGAATTGRYLVRCKENSQQLDNFFNHLYRGTLTFIEVRA